MRQIGIFLFFLSSFGFAHQYSVGLGTDFPLGWSLDGKISFAEKPLFVRLRYGQFLTEYINFMNDFAESQGYYNSATSEIVSESLKNGQLLELAVGYETNPNEGWYGDVAYTSVSGHGEVTGATLVAAVNGMTLPGGTNIYDIKGELQNLTVRVGQRFPLDAQMTISVYGGLMKPIDSKTSVDRDVSGPVQQALLDAANRELDEYMNETYEQDVIIPLIGVQWLISW